MKRIKRINILPVIVLLVFTLQSCNSVNDDWEDAKQGNNVESYRLFIDKHPDSGFRKDATQKIDSILFKNAITALKIKNPKLEKLDPKKISEVLGALKKNEVRDLFSILVERSSYLKGSLNFIAPEKIAEGPDLSMLFKPAKNLVMSGSAVSFDRDNNTRAICKYVGVLKKNTKGEAIDLDQVLIIGKGQYLAKDNVNKINYKGSFTVAKHGKYFLYSTFYPQDILYFGVGGYDAEKTIKLPYGNNTIIRIKGEVDNYFKGISIKSDDSFPLHLILRNNGLYYLMGRGEVRVDNGKPLVF